MKRKDLMKAVAVAAGLAVTANMVTPTLAAPGKSQAIYHANPQGYVKSGNPMAAGGPGNPGKGNPFNAY